MVGEGNAGQGREGECMEGGQERKATYKRCGVGGECTGKGLWKKSESQLSRETRQLGMTEMHAQRCCENFAVWKLCL